MIAYELPTTEPEKIESKFLPLIEYLINSDRDPVLRVVGYFIQAAEGGEFNQQAVIKDIREHLFDIKTKGAEGGLFKHPQIDEKSFFDDDFGYEIFTRDTRVDRAIDNLPDNIKTFLHQYVESLNTKIRESYQKTVQYSQLRKLIGIFRQILKQAQPAERPLLEYEKTRHIAEHFQNQMGRKFAGKPDIPTHAYRQASKKADYMTIPVFRQQEEKLTQVELSIIFVRLFKEIYDEILLNTNPNNNPYHTPLKIAWILQ